MSKELLLALAFTFGVVLCIVVCLLVCFLQAEEM